MATDNQKKEDSWEKEHVRRVLEYHNKKYKSCIAIKDKTQNVRPDLKGKSDWDWVCSDRETGDEVALEVKRLTDQGLEYIGNTTRGFLEEVRDSLTGKLPGIFHLYIDIPQSYCLPIKGQEAKQELRNLLCELICRTVPKLQIREKADLIRRIRLMLRIRNKPGRIFYIPNTLICTLTKIDDEGNVLSLGSGLTYWRSPEVEDAELQKFEQLVSHANEQLKKANVEETFLVFIEGHNGREPSVIAKAFSNINQESYSGIKYVYFVIGEEVAEIPLPIP